MLQVKIFQSINSDNIEHRINEWLKERQNIVIENIKITSIMLPPSSIHSTYLITYKKVS